MKKTLSSLVMLLLLVVAVVLGACTDPYANVSVQFSSNQITIVLGVNENNETSVLATVSGFPKNSTDAVMFTPLVNNVVVRSVDNLGLGRYRAHIKALQPGTSTIKVTTLEGNKTSFFTVHVVQPVQSLAMISNLSPFVLKRANEAASLALQAEKLFEFYPSNTSQKDVQYYLKDEHEFASIDQNTLVLAPEFDLEEIVVVANSLHNNDLSVQFTIKVIEPIDADMVSVNGFSLDSLEMAEENNLVANNLNGSTLRLAAHVNLQKQVKATLTLKGSETMLENNVQINQILVAEQNQFEWSVWIKNLGSYQLSLRIFYEEFDYEVVFEHPALVVNVINQPTDILIDNVSLTEKNQFVVFNKYAPLLNGTLYTVSVAPFNVLAKHAKVTLMQGDRTAGAPFEGLQVFSQAGDELSVGAEIENGSSIYIRGIAGQTGVHAIDFVSFDWKSDLVVRRPATFQIHEGIDAMSGGGSAILEMVANQTSPSILSFMVLPVVSFVDGFGYTITNANASIKSAFTLGEIEEIGSQSWRKIYVPVTPVAEGNVRIVIYSGNGYYVTFDIEIISRISAAAFRLAAPEENSDVRKREMTALANFGYPNLTSAVITSTSSGVALTLVKYPAQSKASVTFVFADYEFDEVENKWSAYPEMQGGKIVFSDTSNFVKMEGSKLIPTNINGGKTMVRAFVETEIVDSMGARIRVVLAPSGSFFRLFEGSYYDISTGAMATDANPAWYSFVIESFVPISKVVINQTSAELFSLSSVGYYNEQMSKVELSITVFPSNATYAKKMVEWNVDRSAEVAGVVLYDFQKENDKAVFTALRLRPNEIFESAKVTVKVSELDDRVFMQYAEIVWSAKEMVSNVVLHNADTLNGIYIENLAGNNSGFNLLATAYPTTAFNKKLVYRFEPNGMTTSGFLRIDEDGKITVMQAGAGGGYIWIAPQDRFHKNGIVIEAKKQGATDETIIKIPIYVVDGSQEEYAIRIFDAQKFEMLRTHPNLFYILCADITLTNFTPIKKFIGSLNGTYEMPIYLSAEGVVTQEITFTIHLQYTSALAWDLTNKTHHGLLFDQLGTTLETEIFEYINVTGLKNLYVSILLDLPTYDIATENQPLIVGGLVGKNIATIQNVKIIDTAFGQSKFVVGQVDGIGSMVGENWGKIEDSSSNLLLSANGNVGGIAAYNRMFETTVSVIGNPNLNVRWMGELVRVRNTGKIAGVGMVGGIAATNATTIANAYVEAIDLGETGLNATTILAKNTSTFAGGLVGEMTAGTITQSYFHSYMQSKLLDMTLFFGDIYAQSGSLGGLVGNFAGGELSQSYAAGALVAVEASAYLGGLFGVMGSELELQPTASDVYALGNYQATQAGALIGYMTRSLQAAPIISRGYSLGVASQPLDVAFALSDESLEDQIDQTFVGSEAQKTLQQWKDSTFDIQNEESNANIWVYGLQIALQTYPYLLHAQAPVAPNELTNLIFGQANEQFVPFKKGGAASNNAVVLFYYEPISNVGLNAQIASRIAQLNTISLPWTVQGETIALGSFLSFETVPSKASKWMEHYQILSSNPAVVKVNNNSTLQVLGIGSATLTIQSKLDATVKISFAVESMYPQGVFQLYLGANSESGIAIKPGNMLRIKRTYSQSITSTYQNQRSLDGLNVRFKVEPVSIVFADELSQVYGTENQNLAVNNTSLGVHIVQGKVSSENSKFTFQSKLNLTRAGILQEVKDAMAPLMTKSFFVQVWEGAESIFASQNSFEIEPILEPTFEFSMITDADETLPTDTIGVGQDKKAIGVENATIEVKILQSHETPVIFGDVDIQRVSETELENGFKKQTYAVTLSYLSDIHKTFIRERMTYSLSIHAKSSMGANLVANVTVVMLPQALYTLSTEHHYSTFASVVSGSGIGEYEFSKEPTTTIAPGESGLLTTQLFPFYASWDSLTIEYQQNQTQAVGFEPLRRLVSGSFVSNTNAVYDLLDYGIRVYRDNLSYEQISTSLDGQKEFGTIYTRLLIGSELIRNTVFTIVVKVYHQGAVIHTYSLDLTAQYLPGATFEIDGVSGDNQLLPRGQDYTLDVILMGTDSMGDVVVTGDSENHTSNSLLSDRMRRVVLSKPTATEPIFDATTNQRIGSKITMRMTVGALAEQTYDAEGKKLDDGFVTITVTTTRVIHGEIEYKDSRITFKVVDYVIEGISLQGTSEQNTTFLNSVEIDKQLAFDYRFKGVDKATGYVKYTNQTLSGTAARDEENNAMAQLAALRASLSLRSPKDGLFVVNGNTESSLITSGNLNALVANRFGVRELFEEDGFKALIITGRNQSTTSLRFKHYETVPGNIELVYAFDFIIQINLYTDEDRPALIYTYQDLYNAIYTTDPTPQDYILMADIALPANFVPFENTAKIASLDGNYKVISFQGFQIPLSSNENDLKSIKLALFDVVSQGTILKNMIVNVGALPVIDLQGVKLASLIYAPFAITNSGIITNSHVQNFSSQPFAVSGKGNLQIANADLTNESAIVMAGFVRTNNETGSITNSSFGGEGAMPSPRRNLVRREISLVGKGNIAAFVNENNGRIVASSALNFTIVNLSESAQGVYSSGFVGTNSALAKITESQARDIASYTKTYTRMGIDSLGIRAGFAFNNLGTLEDNYSNISFTNTTNQIGGYTAGFVYRNQASGVINTSYSKSILNTLLISQSEFSGIDERAKSLNDGKITYSYYASRSLSGAKLNNEDAFKTGASSLSAADNESSFLGFNIASALDLSSGRYGIWRMEAGELVLIEPNKHTVSVRDAKIDPADTTKYFLQYSYETPYGTENNPILIKTADEFNRFISAPTASSMLDKFESYGTTYINRGVFRLVSDLNFDELSAGGAGNLKLGTVRLSLIGGGIQGNGFVLKNVDISSNGLPTSNRTGLGLFKSLEERAYVKNLTIQTKNVSGNDFERAGVLAGSIINSYVVKVNVSKTNESSKVIGKNLVGGLAGVILGNSLIKNVKVEMIVESTHTAANVNSFISNNINIASLSIAGGVAGVLDTALLYGIVSNFDQILVQGNFQVQAMIAGGVAGFIGEHVGANDIKVEVNSGTTFVQRITSTNTRGLGYAGGIAGESKAILNHVRIEHPERVQTEIEKNIATYYAQTNANYARGGNEVVFANSTGYVGGLVGYMSKGQIKNSYAKVSVVAPNAEYAGGLVGYTAYSDPTKDEANEFVRNDLENVYAFGDVNAKKAGGIIGYNTANGLRLHGVVALPYLRLKTSHDDYFRRIVGVHASGVSLYSWTVNEGDKLPIRSVNIIPTGVGVNTTGLLPSPQSYETAFALKDLVPAESNFLNISETFESFDFEKTWTRRQDQSFPTLSFGVPSENVILLKNTQDIKTHLNSGEKGKIYILDPTEGSTIAWPSDNFVVTRFYGTLRSAEGKTVTITNVNRMMFRRIIEAKLINFHIEVNSAQPILDSVLTSELEMSSLINIQIKGQLSEIGAILTKLEQTPGSTSGLGVVAQNANSVNEFDGLVVENFEIIAPNLGISAKEIGVGGVIGNASGSLLFQRQILVKNIAIRSAAYMVTPSTVSAGLVVGNASSARIAFQITETMAQPNIFGTINFNAGITISSKPLEQLSGYASFGGLVGMALQLDATNLKVDAFLQAKVQNGASARISMGGMVGRAIAAVNIVNSVVASTDAKRSLGLFTSMNQFAALGGMVGFAEGEVTVTGSEVRSLMFYENNETENTKANIGGIVGKIDSYSKSGSEKALTSNLFAGVIFVKAHNANIGGIMGSDASNNRARTAIEFSQVGTSQETKMQLPTADLVGHGWSYQEYYYTGTIVLVSPTGEYKVGGIAGYLEKTGADGVGSMASRNLTFGDIVLHDNQSVTLHLGGVIGSAANNYVNENISLTTIKLINQKNTDSIGAIVGHIPSNRWSQLTQGGKNLFSHQMTLAMQEEQSASEVSQNLYLARNIGNTSSLLTELALFGERSKPNEAAKYQTYFKFFAFDLSLYPQGSKLNPYKSTNFSTLTSNNNILKVIHPSLRVRLMQSNANLSSQLSQLQGMLIGDGYTINTNLSSPILTNKGAIAGVGVKGNIYAANNQITAMLVGKNEGIIMSSFAVGTIQGKEGDTVIAAGGLVGENAGRIKDSFAHVNLLYATVSTTSPIGGLVGLSNSNSFIESSYSTGVVHTASQNTGSLVGQVVDNSAHFKSSWTASVALDNQNQVLSKVFPSIGTYLNCYYDQETTKGSSNTKGVKELKNANAMNAIYSNHTAQASTENAVVKNHGYRMLSGGLYATTPYMEVFGNTTNFFQLSELKQFNNSRISETSFKQFYLRLSITLADEWNVIRAKDLSFFGLNNTISNLRYSGSELQFGFFATLENATIHGLKIAFGSNKIISGNVGALVGVAKHVNIIACEITSGSASRETIVGTSSAGGLVGVLEGSSKIDLSKNLGVKVVNAATANIHLAGAGGLVGQVSNNASTNVIITNSSNTGEIQSKLIGGGIVGYSSGSNKVTMKNNTHTGNMTFTAEISWTKKVTVTEVETGWHPIAIIGVVGVHYNKTTINNYEYNYKVHYSAMVGKGTFIDQGQNSDLIGGYSIDLINTSPDVLKNGLQYTNADNSSKPYDFYLRYRVLWTDIVHLFEHTIYTYAIN